MVSSLMKQSWIASGVFLNMMSVGLLISYPYSLLPGLREPDSPIKVDLHTGSTLASSIMSIITVSIVLTNILMEWIGRKRTFTLMLLPKILGWIVIYLSKNMTALMIGRLLGGVWLGSSHVLGCTILGEYISPKHRGLFLAFKTTSLCVGNMLLHVLSQYCNWRTIALLNIIPPVVILFCTYFWPESPSWLATKRRFKRCEDSFFWLRGTNDKSIKEFEALIQSQKVIKHEMKKTLSFTEKILHFFRMFRTKRVIKPILIMIFARYLSEATGRHFFPAFASDIISQINGEKKLQNFMLTLTIDLITIASSIISSILVRLYKRRMLLFLSGCSSLIFLFFFCLYLLIVSQEVISDTRPWIPLTLFTIYYFLANLGCCSIPMILLGEVFPLKRKGAIITVAEVLSSTSLIIFMKITPFMLVNLKVYGTFSVYGLFMIISLLYLYFSLPETSNRTLQEIEECFGNRRIIIDAGTRTVDKDGSIIEDGDDENVVDSMMLQENSSNKSI